MTGIHNLPSEAVKAILALTREQLMELSAVNGQLYSVINSRPLNAKPLLRAGHLFYGVIGPGGDVLTVVYRSATMRYRVGKRLYGLDAAQSFPEQQWIRFNVVNLIASKRKALLEILKRNSHCVRGAKLLRVRLYGRVPEEVIQEITALIDKLRPLVEHVYARMA